MSETEAQPNESDPTDSTEDTDTDDAPSGLRTSISVPAPTGRVWEHLISPAGTHALLGEGAVLGRKSEPWHAADGAHGVVRSFHPLEQLRLTWHPREDGPLSMLDVQLRPAGEATIVDLFHEGLGISGDPQGDKSHWDDALGRLAATLPE